MSTENQEYQEYLKAVCTETLKTIDQQIELKEKEGIAYIKVGEAGWKVLTQNDRNDDHSTLVIRKGAMFVKTTYEIGKKIYDAVKKECNDNL